MNIEKEKVIIIFEAWLNAQLIKPDYDEVKAYAESIESLTVMFYENIGYHGSATYNGSIAYNAIMTHWEDTQEN